MNLSQIAHSRLAEPLSKGTNIKKLLDLHISPYTEQIEKAQTLEDLKDIDASSDTFLEWFGVLKGVLRPKTTIVDQDLSDFFNVMTPDEAGFSAFDISRPLYFGQVNYYNMGDPEFKRVIKAFCKLTGFRGTVEEYSLFFKEIFGIDIQIRVPSLDLEFIVENTSMLNIDNVLIANLTPKLLQTENLFFQSPYPLFSLEFNNIEGTNLDFDGTAPISFYYPF